MLKTILNSNPTGFSPSKDIPDLSGKTILVTGGNTGIGYQTVLQLGLKGAHVYLAARNPQRANDALEKLKEEAPNAKITFLQLDLADLKQVKKAAEEFKSKEKVLDVLVNNAGIMASPFELTKDGYEAQFATNHLGHFLFTTSIVECLENASKPRIVNLSSLAHQSAPAIGIDFEDLNKKDKYNPWTRYGQSKLANILFSKGLNKRYPKIITNSVHPGYVASELGRGIANGSAFLGTLVWISNSLFALNTFKGAFTSLYCAASPTIETQNIRDRYFAPLANLEEPTPLAKNEELAEKLWVFSEKLCKDALEK